MGRVYDLYPLYTQLKKEGLKPIKSLEDAGKDIDDLQGMALFYDDSVKVNVNDEIIEIIPEGKNEILLDKLGDYKRELVKIQSGEDARKELSYDRWVNKMKEKHCLTIISEKHWEYKGRRYEGKHYLQVISEIIKEKKQAQ